MDPELQVINDKIDRLSEQMGNISARLTRLDELKEDMALFASDAFSEVITFMADIDFHFRSQDVVELVKKMMRNVNNLSRMLDMIQSMVELMDDVRPLGKDIFSGAVEKLHQLEKDGVFESLKSLGLVLEKVGREFSPEDISRLGNDLVRMAKMADPLTVSDEKVTLPRLVKKARKTGVLKNMNTLLDILNTISEKNQAKNGGK